MIHRKIYENAGDLRFSTDGLAVGENSSVDAALIPSIFGIAAGHIAAARYELHEIGSIRVCSQGTRLVGLVAAASVAAFFKAKKASVTESELPGLEVIKWVNTATAEDWSEFAEAGHKMYLNTVGPYDLLYTPMGYLCAHRVQSGTDNVGVRVATFCKQELGLAKKLLADREKHGKHNTVMKQLIKCVENIPKTRVEGEGLEGTGTVQGKTESSKAEEDLEDKSGIAAGANTGVAAGDAGLEGRSSASASASGSDKNNEAAAAPAQEAPDVPEEKQPWQEDEMQEQPQPAGPQQLGPPRRLGSKLSNPASNPDEDEMFAPAADSQEHPAAKPAKSQLMFAKPKAKAKALGKGGKSGGKGKQAYSCSGSQGPGVQVESQMVESLESVESVSVVPVPTESVLSGTTTEGASCGSQLAVEPPPAAQRPADDIE